MIESFGDVHLIFLLNKKCPLTEKPARLLENTTDVVFPRREFVLLYRGTLSPLPKTGVFWSFFTPPGCTQHRIYDLFLYYKRLNIVVVVVSVGVHRK